MSRKYASVGTRSRQASTYRENSPGKRVSEPNLAHPPQAEDGIPIETRALRRDNQETKSLLGCNLPFSASMERMRPQPPLVRRLIAHPRHRSGICFVGFLFCTGLVPGAGPVRADSPRPVHFSRDILPILSENCFTCHGPDAKARKADLRLDLEETGAADKDEPVIVPGKSGESELIERVTSKDVDELMPPAEVGQEADRRPDRTLEAVDRSGGELEQALGV